MRSSGALSVLGRCYTDPRPTLPPLRCISGSSDSRPTKAAAAQAELAGAARLTVAERAPWEGGNCRRAQPSGAIRRAPFRKLPIGSFPEIAEGAAERAEAVAIGAAADG